LLERAFYGPDWRALTLSWRRHNWHIACIP